MRFQISHVSTVPNHQTGRLTPLHTRANAAYFGAFGYELDLNALTDEDFEKIKEQVRFMKKYRRLFQFGVFYRLESPFDGNVTGWMVVSEDKKEAAVGWFRVLSGPNQPYSRMRLRGLDENFLYHISVRREKENYYGNFYGDELMNIGLVTSDATSGQIPDGEGLSDFESRLFILEVKE